MKRLATLLLFLMATSVFASTETWWDAYARGVAAVNARNYASAATTLERCISEMPNESNAARTRSQIIIYVPHFYLGIARFNLGDVDAALREWKISEDQGAIRNTDYYTKLKEWVGRAQTEKAHSAQNAAADSKKQADAALSRALSGQMEAVAAGGDRIETYRAAQRKLQEALQQFNSAGTDPHAYKHAADTAAQAREMFASAADEGKRLKASRPAVAQKPAPVPQPVKPVPVPVEPPPQVVQSKPQIVPPPPAKEEPKATPAPVAVSQTAVESEELVAARLAVQQYRRRLIEKGTAPKDPAMVSVEKMEKQLAGTPDSKVIASVSDAVAKHQHELDAKAPPVAVAAVVAQGATSRPQLEAAYRAYAAGNMARSEELLTTIISSQATGEAYLLRGCARYTRALLSRQPAPLVAQATGDFRQALQLNRALRLDARSFSPKLVTFFDEVRGR